MPVPYGQTKDVSPVLRIKHYQARRIGMSNFQYLSVPIYSVEKADALGFGIFDGHWGFKLDVAPH
jgi:hypothetical protein